MILSFADQRFKEIFCFDLLVGGGHRDSVFMILYKINALLYNR